MLKKDNKDEIVEFLRDTLRKIQTDCECPDHIAEICEKALTETTF